MGDELTHFSVLDAESSTNYFLNWAGDFGGGANLRGGNRVVSDTPSDSQVQVETTPPKPPTGADLRAVPLAEHAISQVGTPSPQAPFTKSTGPLVTKTTNAPHIQSLPGAFPATPQNAQQTGLADLSTPVGSPVTSVAHRRQVYQNKHPSPGHVAVNKLDETPGRKSVTPTQQRLLQRLGSGEQQVGQTDQVPSINRPRAKVPQLERVESIEETRVQQADSMSSAPVTKSVGPGPETNTMSLFDAMEKRYFAPSAVTEGKPAAEEFCSPPAHYVIDEKVTDVPTMSEAEVRSEVQTADANSDEGGMDLTPVLKALGARPTASTSIQTTISESSAINIEHLQATPAQEVNEDMLPAPTDHSDAKAKAAAIVPSAGLGCKIASRQPIEPVEEEALEVVSSKSRTVLLRNLPGDSDYTFVQSLVYGASIESMKLYPETHTATVTLTDMEDCQRYIDSCSNGINVKFNRVQHTVLAERSPGLDTSDDRLQAYLDCGATRVVKIEDADEDMTAKALYIFAEGPSQSREVESIIDSCRRGIRNILFRFSSIPDAVAFRSALLRDQRWRSRNPHFAEDPCESATGPRSD